MARIPVTIATHLGRSTLSLPNKALDLDASMMPEVATQFLTRRDQDCIDDVDDAVRSLNIRGQKPFSHGWPQSRAKSTLAQKRLR